MQLGWAVLALVVAAQEDPPAADSSHLVVVQRLKGDAFTGKSLAVYPHSVAVRLRDGRSFEMVVIPTRPDLK